MQIDGDDDEENLIAGPEGEGTEGQDDGGGQPEGELPAEHADQEADAGEPEVAAAPTRGSKEFNFRELREQARAAREEAAAARREAEELRRQQAQGQQRQTEQQEREMLALMTPDERADYRIKQTEQRLEGMLRQTQMQTAAQMDKAAFDAKATINPVYARHAAAIEAKFQDQLRQGRPVEREILLKLHLGELALQGAGKAGQQRRQAQNRVQAQRVPAGNGKSDAASVRGKAGDTAESRLKDVLI